MSRGRLKTKLRRAWASNSLQITSNAKISSRASTLVMLYVFVCILALVAVGFTCATSHSCFDRCRCLAKFPIIRKSKKIFWTRLGCPFELSLHLMGLGFKLRFRNKSVYPRFYANLFLKKKASSSHLQEILSKSVFESVFKNVHLYRKITNFVSRVLALF